jgi:hypothetical protein
MAPRGKKGVFRGWLSGFFVSKDNIPYIREELRFGSNDSLPLGPRPQARPGGFISHAQDFSLHNPTMTSVQGNQYTTYVQRDRNTVPQSA